MPLACTWLTTDKQEREVDVAAAGAGAGASAGSSLWQGASTVSAGIAATAGVILAAETGGDTAAATTAAAIVAMAVGSSHGGSTNRGCLSGTQLNTWRHPAWRRAHRFLRYDASLRNGCVSEH